MKKMLLVCCFLAVASLAANATTGFTVTFNGYCDGMNIANYTGIIFGGNHNNYDCAGSVAHGGGFRHAAPGYTVYTGAAFDFMDWIFASRNSSLQFLLQVSGTVRRPGPCGWVIYYGPDGVGNYYLNSGGCTLVSRPVRTGGTKSTTMR